MVLPGIDGPTVASRALEERPDLRVAFVSGFTDDALERHGLDPSTIRLLQKPFTRDALLAFVAEAFDGTDPPTASFD